MTNGEIADRTVALVAEIFGEDPEEIDRDTDFIADLHAKSMDIVALVAALEDEFAITFSVSDVQNNRTVGEAVDWLEERVEEKQ
jgi:acyl carrier protein